MKDKQHKKMSEQFSPPDMFVYAIALKRRFSIKLIHFNLREMCDKNDLDSCTIYLISPFLIFV